MRVVFFKSFKSNRFRRGGKTKKKSHSHSPVKDAGSVALKLVLHQTRCIVEGLASTCGLLKGPGNAAGGVHAHHAATPGTGPLLPHDPILLTIDLSVGDLIARPPLQQLPASCHAPGK